MLWFRFYIGVFSYRTFTEMFAIGLQKRIDHERLDFGVLCWKMGSFVRIASIWFESCKNCSIVILIGRHHFFSMFSLKGVLVSCLKMLVLFSPRIL